MMVAAYFEKHFSGEISAWTTAIDKVGEVVTNLGDKLRIVQ